MQNEWVLITGASVGIGRELAKVFASHGYDLVLLARDGAKLKQLADELVKQHGIKTKVLVKDLAQSSAPIEIFQTLQQQQISISILVNNAGFGLDSFFAKGDLQIFTNMVQVNVIALMQLTQLFVKPMIERGHGKILNVASTAAFQPGPRMAVYYASKSFVFSLSYALANEVEEHGITVTTLCPGPTRTEFQARAGTKRSSAINKWTMTAEAVAVAGYEGLMKGKRVVIPGMLNKIGVTLARWFPTRLTTAVARKVVEA